MSLEEKEKELTRDLYELYCALYTHGNMNEFTFEILTGFLERKTVFSEKKLIKEMEKGLINFKTN